MDFLLQCFKLWWICCVPPVYGRGSGKTFSVVLETGHVLCFVCIGWAFCSSIYPEANGCSKLEFLQVSTKDLLPKDTGFPLTRYNLGASAHKGDVSWKCAPETFLFNHDTTAWLCDSLLRPQERNSWDRRSKILNQTPPPVIPTAQHRGDLDLYRTIQFLACFSTHFNP